MKIRYVTLLAAIAGLMAACGNDRKAGMQPDPSLKEAASGKFLMGVADYEKTFIAFLAYTVRIVPS